MSSPPPTSPIIARSRKTTARVFKRGESPRLGSFSRVLNRNRHRAVRYSSPVELAHELPSRARSVISISSGDISDSSVIVVEAPAAVIIKADTRRRSSRLTSDTIMAGQTASLAASASTSNRHMSEETSHTAVSETASGSNPRPARKRARGAAKSATSRPRSSLRSKRAADKPESPLTNKSLYYEGSSEEDEGYEQDVMVADEDKGQTSNGKGRGSNRPHKHKSNEVPAKYIHTFTTALDYPRVPNPDGSPFEGHIESPWVTVHRKTMAAKLAKQASKSTGDAVPAPVDPLAPPAHYPSKPTGVSLLPPMANPANENSNPTPATTNPEPNPENNPQMKKLRMKSNNRGFSAQADEMYKTNSPRYPKARETRLFGLKECPVLYPTEEEFADPMSYIKKIGETGRGKEFGIVKVVPPEGWRMPLKIDYKTFRFQTRLQRLNSLEATSRAKFNFLEQLYMFHKQQGNPDVVIPVIDHRPLDVWALRKEVANQGGADQITISKGWGSVARALSYTQAHAPHLKSAYVKIVQPFDDFYEKVKGAPLASVIDRKTEGEDVKPADPATSTPKKAAGGRQATSTSPAESETKRSLRNASKTIPSSTSNVIVVNAAKQEDLDSEVGDTNTSGSPQTKHRESISRANSEYSLASAMEEDAEVVETETIDVGGTKDGLREHTPAPSLKRKRKGTRGTAPSTPVKRSTRNHKPRKDVHYEKGDICEVCLLGKDAAKILLCDECERGFHIYCLNPPLESIPDIDEWYCPSCLLSTGHDYGFDEGEEHTFWSFQERANAFKTDWFVKHPPTADNSHLKQRRCNGEIITEKINGNLVTEGDIEEQFWQLVESQYMSVEVEYGADIHSTTHGSAAPTMETHPLNKYSADPWNLNNLPILPQSLLRYIKSDISGMTVPWTYIGMLFSTFCWHNEDHHTYSVNYHHVGDTKTWYTVPGSSAEKFEEAMRKEAPELFDQQPSLLYQLVTLLNPGRLQELGVDVSACDQRPNEFVITWPKAYHCGFNHGFNLNEAVNFALPDWLPFGYDCVQRYQLSAKAPVFSHEELLITISQYSDAVETAVWIEDQLSTMIVRELEKRDELRRAEIHIGEILDNEDKPEDQYMCFKCKAFCYLSQVICQCTRQVACTAHGQDLCKCPSGARTLRKRYSESQLIDIQRAVSERAAVPQTWRARFESILAESARPSVKALRALVAEGERIAHPMPELSTLRTFVAHVNDWMARAGSFLNRKKVGGRKRISRIREDDADSMTVDSEDVIEISRKPAEDAIQQLLQAAEKMAFDTPEILQLRQLVDAIHEFRQQAIAFLSDPEQAKNTKACRAMFLRGESLNVETPELQELDMIIRRREWFDTINNLDENFLELSDVENYLEQAFDCEIDPGHELVANLRSKQVRGLAWRRRAEIVVASCSEPENNERNITLDELDFLSRQDNDTPVKGELVVKILELRRKAHGVIQSCQSLLNANPEEKKNMLHVRKLLKSADTKAPGVIIPELEAVEGIITQYDEWMRRVGKLVGETKQPGEGVDKLLRDTQQLLDSRDDAHTKETNAVMEPDISWDGCKAAVSRFNCVCRQPARPKMLQCRKCLELYHYSCIDSIYVEGPQTRLIKCFFCRSKDTQGQKPQPRPSLLKFMPMVDSKAWKLEVEFDELKQIREVIALCQNAGDIILPNIQPSGGKAPTDDTRFLRHWLRKLRDLPINIEVRGSDDQNISLYPALLSRLKHVRRARAKTYLQTGRDPGSIVPVTNPAPPRPVGVFIPEPEAPLKITKAPTAQDALEVARRRYRWPWFYVELYAHSDCTCFCPTPPARPDDERVTCGTCEQQYHRLCSKVGIAVFDSKDYTYNCPQCCVNLRLPYSFANIQLWRRERISDHRGLPKDRLIQIDWRTSEEDGRLVDIPPEVRPLPEYNAVNLVMMRFEAGAARDIPRVPEGKRAAMWTIREELDKAWADSLHARARPSPETIVAKKASPSVVPSTMPQPPAAKARRPSHHQKPVFTEPQQGLYANALAAAVPRSHSTEVLREFRARYQGLTHTAQEQVDYARAYSAHLKALDAAAATSARDSPPRQGFRDTHRPSPHGRSPPSRNVTQAAPPTVPRETPVPAHVPTPTPTFGQTSAIQSSFVQTQDANAIKPPRVLPTMPPARPLNSFTAGMVIPAFRGVNNKAFDPRSEPSKGDRKPAPNFGQQYRD